MALTVECLRAVRLALDPERGGTCESRKMLSLGYPDIAATADEIASVFDRQLAERLTFRADSEGIARWHGLKAAQFVDANSLATALGYELEVLDVVEARGGERLHDLNYPVPQALHGRYGLVIDPGTLEHCFNIAQAAKNVAEMVSAGGCALHLNPLNMHNHGFYNLNPTWYHDFYLANGFEIEFVEAVSGSGPKRQFRVPPIARFRDLPAESSICVLVRRRSVQPITWPLQSKYVQNPRLSA